MIEFWVGQTDLDQPRLLYRFGTREFYSGGQTSTPAKIDTGITPVTRPPILSIFHGQPWDDEVGVWQDDVGRWRDTPRS